MLKSMTGFGAGSAKAGGLQVRVELSSVNRKQLDVSLRFPSVLGGLEAQAQKVIKETVSRGRISGSVEVEEAGRSGGIRLNQKKAAAAVKQLRETAETLKLEDRLDAGILLQIPGLFQSEAAEFEPEGISGVLEKALKAALKNLDIMRVREGRALAADLRGRLKALEAVLSEIKRLAPQVTANYRQKLFSGLKNCGIETIETDERVLREIALFGEKADISEEITRLQSHIQQFRAMMSGSESAGRPLDFLAQEMFREINTIGSKAGDLQITGRVVAFKTELERIREQIQNIE